MGVFRLAVQLSNALSRANTPCHQTTSIIHTSTENSLLMQPVSHREVQHGRPLKASCPIFFFTEPQAGEIEAQEASAGIPPLLFSLDGNSNSPRAPILQRSDLSLSAMPSSEAHYLIPGLFSLTYTLALYWRESASSS